MGAAAIKGVTIVYLHLENIQVKLGQRVQKGAYLGDVMNIGGPAGIPLRRWE
jgi:murein DD-endopeptidase MepM/ murein hydrolase activator NlpD